MTVSTTDSVVTYIAGGPGYAIPYRFLQNADIEAVLAKQDGTLETLSPTQYTITGAGSQNGGTLTSTYAAGVLATPGASLTISRVMTAVQPTDLRNQGRYFAETHENVFDRLTMLIQQGIAGLSRALVRPIGKSYYDAEARRIARVAEPVDGQDAATKDWSLRSIADVIGGMIGNPNLASNVFYQGPNGLPYTVQDLSNRDDSGKGSALVGWKRSPLRKAINTAGQMLDAQAISVWERADLITDKPDPSDPDTWDWTPAFQALFDLAIPLIGTTPGPDFPRIAIMIPAGIYHLTSAEVGSKIDIFCAGGVIRPFDVAASADYVLKMTNFNRVYNLTIDMDYSVTYRESLWIRGRHNHLFGCSFWKARNAMTFGDPVWATTPSLGVLGDSENILSSCETVWCVTAFHTYGQNTILHFDDCLLYSSVYTLPDGDPRKAFWESLPAIVAYNWGSLVYTTGGCVANFTPLYPVFKSELQPVSGNVDYVNSFGRFYMNGTHIETGNLIETGSVGAYPAQDVSSNVLTMQGCNGYLTSNPAYFINLGADCRQFVSIDGTNRLYGYVSSRLVYSIGAPAHVSPMAFANLPADFFQCITVLHPRGYENYCALDASQSLQAFTSAFSVFKPTVLNQSDVNDALKADWFNTGTGVFSARADMRNALVRVSLSFTGGLASDSTVIRVMLNGVQQDQAIVNGSSPSAMLQVSRIPQGALLSVEVSQTQGRSANGSNANRIVLSASI